jgi:hypothetical protein
VKSADLGAGLGSQVDRAVTASRRVVTTVAVGVALVDLQDLQALRLLGRLDLVEDLKGEAVRPVLAQGAVESFLRALSRL